ncbi:BTAD domain-containing putative transcriptional regulator [Streptomyces sp. NPDC101178]|uniref:BTAD domain-containing putative transcriptional regulator n=1 Tax=Streptomyces sp. NPDC101178 TaxID=3366124 RepID=UPI00381041A4
MQFRMLGPMEVVDAGGVVGLGGTKQRATLGLLLLQANKVVATSRLMNALWGVDDAPATARKILQNAIYGLRGALDRRHDELEPGAATLLTQPPGYMMRVDPEQVDLHVFHKEAARGREQLARGTAESASATLRDALALWRGPVLADLVEAGIQWPELAAVESTRLDVMEDFFDAQLACGRHHAVLAELETMVQAEPLRERSCGQLMLALYRCGRQVDALNAYSRVRSVLVESLGLEPGRGLQQLQQAILVQDPVLSLPEPGTLGGLVGHADPVQPPRSQQPHPAPWAGEPVPGTQAPREAMVPGPAPAPSADGQRVPHQRGTDGPEPGRRTGPERRRVSVLSVRTRLAPSLADGISQDLDALLEGTGRLVREQVERFGGTVTAAIGSVSLALFGLDGPSEDAARQAVLAALAIRGIFDVAAEPDSEAAQLSVQASVTMGEVLLRRRGPDEAPTVVGSVLDESQVLLAKVPDGEVRVCDAVRRASEHAVLYRLSSPSPASWQPLGVREEGGEDELHGPGGSSEAYELDILRGLVKHAQRRGVPHLVTVLGERGTGKSRVLREFERWVTVRGTKMRAIGVRVPSPADDPCKLAVPTHILSAYCGIKAADDMPVARALLAREVRSLYHSERTSAGLVSLLTHLIDVVGADIDDVFGELRLAEVMDAWVQVLQEAARREPLVLCIDDLHLADDVVVDAVEKLVETVGSGPLFVVVGARTELLRRRPGWAGGKSHATTVTLDMPERVTNEQLVELLLSAARSEDTQSYT